MVNEFDKGKMQALVDIIRDPKTDDKARFECASEILDVCDPEYAAELARLDAYDALEGMKELARTAKDPDIRRQAEQAVEEAEWARQAHIRKITGNED